MSAFFYRIGVQLYVLAIRIAALWNGKARSWVDGRKHQWTRLAELIRPDDQTIWIHCASAGELEQGKPVIEALKREYPFYRIVLSFFSPSGYEAGKKYKFADVICYLPADTPSNAKRFLQVVHASLVVFVKYEYWYYHLNAVAKQNIPLLLVSAIFREDQVFFKYAFFKNLLKKFTTIFVQNQQSVELLHHIGISAICSGDTRFDRVLTIASSAARLPLIESFIRDRETIIAGSTWPEDEALLEHALDKNNAVLILAPHEITPAHLDTIASRFKGSIRYSQLEQQADAEARVLVIDNMGMLSRLYRYATIAYIGGGFNRSGIHNTLEAAVFGKPILIGPNYTKFAEARKLVENGAAVSVDNASALQAQVQEWLQDSIKREKAGEMSARIVAENSGATKKILELIQEKRLLTR